MKRPDILNNNFIVSSAHRGGKHTAQQLGRYAIYLEGLLRDVVKEHWTDEGIPEPHWFSEIPKDPNG